MNNINNIHQNITFIDNFPAHLKSSWSERGATLVSDQQIIKAIRSGNSFLKDLVEDCSLDQVKDDINVIKEEYPLSKLIFFGKFPDTLSTEQLIYYYSVAESLSLNKYIDIFRGALSKRIVQGFEQNEGRLNKLTKFLKIANHLPEMTEPLFQNLINTYPDTASQITQELRETLVHRRFYKKTNNKLICEILNFIVNINNIDLRNKKSGLAVEFQHLLTEYTKIVTNEKGDWDVDEDLELKGNQLYLEIDSQNAGRSICHAWNLSISLYLNEEPYKLMKFFKNVDLSVNRISNSFIDEISSMLGEFEEVQHSSDDEESARQFDELSMMNLLGVDIRNKTHKAKNHGSLDLELEEESASADKLPKTHLTINTQYIRSISEREEMWSMLNNEPPKKNYSKKKLRRLLSEDVSFNFSTDKNDCREFFQFLRDVTQTNETQITLDVDNGNIKFRLSPENGKYVVTHTTINALGEKENKNTIELLTQLNLNSLGDVTIIHKDTHSKSAEKLSQLLEKYSLSNNNDEALDFTNIHITREKQTSKNPKQQQTSSKKYKTDKFQYVGEVAPPSNNNNNNSVEPHGRGVLLKQGQNTHKYDGFFDGIHKFSGIETVYANKKKKVYTVEGYFENFKPVGYSRTVTKKRNNISESEIGYCSYNTIERYIPENGSQYTVAHEENSDRTKSILKLFYTNSEELPGAKYGLVQNGAGGSFLGSFFLSDKQITPIHGQYIKGTYNIDDIESLKEIQTIDGDKDNVSYQIGETSLNEQVLKITHVVSRCELSDGFKRNFNKSRYLLKSNEDDNAYTLGSRIKKTSGSETIRAKSQ